MISSSACQQFITIWKNILRLVFEPNKQWSTISEQNYVAIDTVAALSNGSETVQRWWTPMERSDQKDETTRAIATRRD